MNNIPIINTGVQYPVNTGTLVKLYVRPFGASGGTTFYDWSNYGRVVQAGGTSMANSNTTSKFGDLSLKFNTTGWLHTADSADLTLSNPSTVAFWLYTSNASTTVPFGQYQDGNNNIYCVVQTTGDMTMVCVAGGGQTLRIQTGAGAIPNSTWCHVVIHFNGAASKIYVNTTDKTTSVPYYTSSPNITGDFNIGFLGTGSAYLPGYMDEFIVGQGGLIPPAELYNYNRRIQ